MRGKHTGLESAWALYSLSTSTCRTTATWNNLPSGLRDRNNQSLEFHKTSKLSFFDQVDEWATHIYSRAVPAPSPSTKKSETPINRTLSNKAHTSPVPNPPVPSPAVVKVDGFSQPIPTSIEIIIDQITSNWKYGNGKTEEEWIPFLDIKKELRFCTLIIENITQKEWNGKACVYWAKKLNDSPKIEKIDIVLHYRKGIVDTLYFENGKRCLKHGQKHNVKQIAWRVWVYEKVKTIGFTINEKVEKGIVYPFYRVESEGMASLWGDWTQDWRRW